MTIDCGRPSLKVRYDHVGRHRDLKAQYNGRKIFYAILFALTFDLGFFCICAAISAATEQAHHGTIVRYHPAPISVSTNVVEYK